MRRLIFIAGIASLVIAAWATAQIDTRKLPQTTHASSSQQVPSDSTGEGVLVLTRLETRKYQKTLDALFRANFSAEASDQIVLRISYEPSFEPERAILLRCSLRGDAVIEEIIAKTSVYQAMSNALKREEPNGLEDIEKRVVISRRSFDLAEEEAVALTVKLLHSWTESVQFLSDEFAKSHKTRIGKVYLDGARYRISLRLDGSQMELEFSRPEMPVEQGDDSLPVVEVIGELFEDLRRR